MGTNEISLQDAHVHGFKLVDTHTRRFIGWAGTLDEASRRTSTTSEFRIQEGTAR